MKRAENFSKFYKSLLEAASKIDKRYYKVKVAYFNQTMYRENVYCYELYHQLRKILGDDYDYILSGEIDKASHPDVVERCLEFKSNFLIHQPGSYTDETHLSIIFVYSLQYAFRYPEMLIENFGKMNCATNVKGGYYRGIMLLYGDEKEELDRGVYDIYKNYCREMYDKIILLYHNSVGEKPVKIDVNR